MIAIRTTYFASLERVARVIGGNTSAFHAFDLRPDDWGYRIEADKGEE